MIDLDILKWKGITEASLKDKLKDDLLQFKPQPTDEQGQKLYQLRNRIRSRIMEGQQRNYSNFRPYHALDIAWESSQRAISPTLLQQFLDSDPSDQEVVRKMESWGLTQFITEETDPKSGKATGKKVMNLPVFFKVIVPLVCSYVKIRWAKIMNDLRLTPFFKYEPVKQTTALRLKCEALTDRIQVMANQYGYYEVVKQSVLMMLHYGFCLQFPKKEWDYEEQLRYANEQDVEAGKKKANGDPVDVGDTIKVTVREGIPYHHPHPTRTFWDLGYAPFTLNYDYGCSFAGYWQVMRYRDVLACSYWNTERISYGKDSPIAQNQLFFQSVYSGCVMTMPLWVEKTSDGGGAFAAGIGAPASDRERQLAEHYYGNDFMDQGVMVTEYFEKLVPSENGLGDYDYPVWFRFVVAGDNYTILYAAPLPYAPVIYYGYDADQNRGTSNASLSMEVLPFQDQFSNILTQIVLTAQQNLANLSFVDEDAFASGAERDSSKMLDRIRNVGQKLYATLNIFSYSSKAMNKMRAGDRVQTPVVQSWNFPRGNTAELIQVLKTILDVLERVLVMSSQEVAQSASHEQTREEVKNIAQSTSTRVVFTATPVEIAMGAMMRQLYQGEMAFGDDDYYLHLSSDLALTQEQLDKLGFTYVDKDTTGPNEAFRRVRVDKKKSAPALWEFASSRGSNDRSSDAQMGQVLASITKDMLSNPLTAQAIGADQAIEIANLIAQFMGAPRDFKLRNMQQGGSPEQAQAAAQEQLKQLLAQVEPMIHQVVSQEIVPLLDHEKKQDEQLSLMQQKNGNGNGKAKESISFSYKDAPPSIRRQIEMAAGFIPAIEHEVSPNAPEPIEPTLPTNTQ